MIIIQSLWIGKLTNYEIVSINSFLKYGYEFHLYIYNPIENIPSQVIIKDANEIIPSSEIFYYQESITPFSDVFRYKLLYLKGNIWTDLDVFCNGYFDDKLQQPYLFVAERTIKQGAFKSILPYKALNCFIYVNEINNTFFEYLYNECIKLKSKQNTKIRKNNGLTAYHWAGGIKFFNKSIQKYNLDEYIDKLYFGFPIDWWNWNKLFIPNTIEFDIGKGWEGITNLENILNNEQLIIIHNGWIKNKKINKNTLLDDINKDTFIYKLLNKIII